jgi:glucoamylase
MTPGSTLRIETIVPALVHWSADGWRTTHDAQALDSGLGEYVTDLPTGTLPAGVQIVFTFYWPEAARWEGVDFSVAIADS